MANKRLTLDKLMRIDRRIIYVVFALAVLIPLIFPIGIPIVVSDYTKDFYDEIETLQKDDKVVVDLSYDTIGYADANYQTQAVVEHLGIRGVKIYFLCGEIVSVNYADDFVNLLEEKFQYVYGEDMVVSPYLVGMEQGRKAFASDPQNLFPNDAYGNAMEDLPFMQELTSVWDFECVLTCGTSIAHEYWLKQVPGMKILAPIGSSTLANITTYLNSGQIAAILPGVRSAAEYESLLGLPGQQMAKMDAQSLGILSMLIFILLGNIGYFASKKSQKR